MSYCASVLSGRKKSFARLTHWVTIALLFRIYLVGKYHTWTLQCCWYSANIPPLWYCSFLWHLCRYSGCIRTLGREKRVQISRWGLQSIHRNKRRTDVLSIRWDIRYTWWRLLPVECKRLHQDNCMECSLLGFLIWQQSHVVKAPFSCLSGGEKMSALAQFVREL